MSDLESKIKDEVGYPDRRIIRMKQLLRKFPFSESHIYGLIQKGLFPKPFPLIPGGRSVGWYESEIDLFIASQAKAREE